MLIERSMHPQWLSNAYFVADRPGGVAVLIDTGAPLGPLFEAVEREDVTVTHLLTTHADADHVHGHPDVVARFEPEVLAHPAERVDGATPLEHGDVVETGDLRIEALFTPGHSPGHLAFHVNTEVCFTADVLFRDAVGGTTSDFEGVRRSVMDVLMHLPHETRVLPGHTEETTIGREWEANPFVRVWRGVEQEGTDPCRVGGRAATLIVWSPDYDGKGKAWVRFEDGTDVIVGGSRVDRADAR